MNNKEFEDLFWSHVDIGDPDNCWNWTLSKDHSGYGKVKRGGRMLISHRVAYELRNQEFDKSLHVLHSCDNPACCNPKHLHAGTHKDNMQEMIKRGRRKSPKEWKIKMTKEKASQMRKDYKNGQSKKSLSKKYSISCSQVRDILNGVCWR